MTTSHKPCHVSTATAELDASMSKTRGPRDKPPEEPLHSAASHGTTCDTAPCCTWRVLADQINMGHHIGCDQCCSRPRMRKL